MRSSVVAQLLVACGQIGCALSLLQTGAVRRAGKRLGRGVDNVKFYVYNVSEYEPRFNGNLKNCERKGADYMFLQKILKSPGRVYNSENADVVVVPCLFESFRRCTTTNHAEKPPPSLLQRQSSDHAQPNLHPEDVEEVPWTKVVDYSTQVCLDKVMDSKVYKAKSGRDHFWVVADWAMQFGKTAVTDLFKNMSVGRIEVVDETEAKLDHREECVNQSRCSVVVPYASDVAYQIDLQKTTTFEDWAKRKHLVSFRFEDRQYTFFCKNRPLSDSRSCPDAVDATPLRKQSLTLANRSSMSTSIAMERVTIEEYTEEVENSKFCLVIRGDTPSSHGLYDALAGNCIPILVSDRFDAVAAPMSHYRNGKTSGAMDLGKFVIRYTEDKWMNQLDDVISELETMGEWQQRALFNNMVKQRPSLLWSAPGHEVADAVLSSAAQCNRQYH